MPNDPRQSNSQYQQVDDQQAKPQSSACAACVAEGKLIVNALRTTRLEYVSGAFRRDTDEQGGFEQQIPPQEAVMMLGLPALS